MRHITIQEYLHEQGFSTVPDAFRSKISEWREWYEGNVKSFHPYQVYNGKRHIQKTRCSLGMAKKVCEDWASLLMNEKVSVVLSGAAEQEFLDSVLEQNNFRVRISEMQEVKSALGTVAYIPYAHGVQINAATNEVVGGGTIKINYVTAENIYPLSWENGIIQECAFTSSFSISELGKKEIQNYLYLQTHALKNGMYEIYNTIFRVNGYGLDLVEDMTKVQGFEQVAPVIYTHSPRRQFVIDRLNIANNYDIDNPMGIAVYANAIDVLKGIDIVYDSYNNEFVLGKKRIVVSDSAVQIMGDNMVFDPNDVTFYSIPEGEDSKPLIHEIDMTLRAEEHETSLQSRLNTLSTKCGFGERFYNFNNNGQLTATQVISENSSLFRTLKKHETILESCLKDLVGIILQIGRDVLKQPLNPDVEISIDFDDSIIENKETDFNLDARMVQMGIMRLEEFRAKYMNEDIEQAKQNLPEMLDLTREDVI